MKLIMSIFNLLFANGSHFLEVLGVQKCCSRFELELGVLDRVFVLGLFRLESVVDEVTYHRERFGLVGVKVLFEEGFLFFDLGELQVELSCKVILV